MKYMPNSLLVMAAFVSQASLAHPGHQHILQSGDHLLINSLMPAIVIAGVVLGVRALIRRRDS